MLQTAQGETSRDILKGVALTALIFAIAVYLPLIGFFCALLLPLPILFYRLKLGRAYGAVTLIIILVAIYLILGGISLDIVIFTCLVILGFSLSEFIEKNVSAEKLIVYACGMTLSAGTAALIFFNALTDNHVANLVAQNVASAIKLTIAAYETIGIPEEKIYFVSQHQDKIQYVLVGIIPSLAVAATLFIAWINVLLARPILKKRNLFFPEFGRLNLWKAPNALVWFVIGCFFMIIQPNQLITVAGLNVLIVLMTIYFFQGIAIVSFYFEKQRLSRMLKIFLYSIIAMQHIVLLFVIGVGFFDLWVDFRKLEKKEIEE